MLELRPCRSLSLPPATLRRRPGRAEMDTDALQGKGERSWEGHGKEAAREEEIKDNNIRAFL